MPYYNQRIEMLRSFNMQNQKTSQQIRFEKEAKALQKNIAKRKKQQQKIERKKQKKENIDGQD